VAPIGEQPEATLREAILLTPIGIPFGTKEFLDRALEEGLKLRLPSTTRTSFGCSGGFTPPRVDFLDPNSGDQATVLVAAYPDVSRVSIDWIEGDDGSVSLRTGAGCMPIDQLAGRRLASSGAWVRENLVIAFWDLGTDGGPLEVALREILADLPPPDDDPGS
jgi:hypothetical protein